MEDDGQWKTTFIGEISRFCSAIYRRCGHFLLGLVLFSWFGLVDSIWFGLFEVIFISFEVDFLFKVVFVHMCFIFESVLIFLRLSSY